MIKLAVIGASGQVGATLVEDLMGRSDIQVVPFIHSSGNAWRLTRRPIELKMVDLLDPAATTAALRGFTHVVNCSRGTEETMLAGLDHLLSGCLENRVERFVHISSVLVYGDPPDPRSATESGPTTRDREGYGAIKLRQDLQVAAAAKQGLSAITLCPPNISGAYSPFLVGLAQALWTGKFALVSDRQCPVNLVDVNNLVHAIELALTKGPSDGSRLFVTDDEALDWSDLVREVCDTFRDSGPEVRSITTAELAKLATQLQQPAGSLMKSVKHLVSGDVRAALRQDPYLARAELLLRGLAAKSGKTVEERLRRAVVVGPNAVARVSRWQHLNVPLSAQQLRGVRHSCAALKDSVGYRPRYSFAASVEGFKRWYRTVHGLDTEYWPLIRHLA
jgi:nucleoside-diphosphate-sugar epimerase